MKRLVSTRSKLLDSSLFRTKLSPCSSPTLISAFNGLRIHPLVWEALRQCTSPVWSELSIRIPHAVGIPASFLFSELLEVAENASEPVFTSIRVQVWPTCLPKSCDARASFGLVTGTLNERGEAQPVTVEELIKCILGVMEAGRHTTGLGKKFNEGLKKHMLVSWSVSFGNSQGCLHLENPGWEER